MKVGFRKPSIKRSLKARTTGRAKRAVKKSVNPLYGKKGMGLAKNPSRSVKNAVYKRTTVGVSDIVGKPKKAKAAGHQSDGEERMSMAGVIVVILVVLVVVGAIGSCSS